MNNKKLIHSQGRQIIYNVYKYMQGQSESMSKTTLFENVSRATGVSISSVVRICKEGSSEPDHKFSSPRKSIKKPKVKSQVDEFDQEVIRRIIYSFATTHMMRPNMVNLFQAVKEAGVDFQGKIDSFRKLVRSMGFRWKKTQDNRKALMEKTEIRAKRVEYLRKIKKYREDGRNIVYTDETYLHSSHTVPKAWDDGTSNCIKSPVAKGKRLIIVHAGGSKGFVKDSLLIFKSGLKTGDYHDDMNHKNYKTWLTTKLIPNLEPNSVLVIDNASYHNVSVEANPTSSWKKVDMQMWLTARNIYFSSKETKPELYEKIKNNKPAHKRFVIDTLLAEHGHTVLRLPPYHPEFNPIEKIWALLKNHVAACNVTFKLDDVWKLAEDKFKIIGLEEWQKICDHVIKIEQEYMQREHIMDDIQEIIFRVNEDSDSSDEDESDLCESDDEIGTDAVGLDCEPSTSKNEEV